MLMLMRRAGNVDVWGDFHVQKVMEGAMTVESVDDETSRFISSDL